MPKAVPYSASEQRLLTLLPSDGSKITSTALIATFYGDDGPFFARAALHTLMRHLMRKVEVNAEPFTIRKTARRGPVLTKFWIDRGSSHDESANDERAREIERLVTLGILEPLGDGTYRAVLEESAVAFSGTRA